MAQELTDLDGLGNAMASKIQSIGIDSLEGLATADADELSELDGISQSRARDYINQANEAAVLIQSGEDVRSEYENLTMVSTGIESLDGVLGGGWESGYLVAVGGETGSGKTQLGFQALGESVVDQDAPAVYIETERGRYRGKRIAEMYDEDVQSQVYKVGAYDLDQQRMAYSKVRDAFEDVACVVVDSFTARFRLSGEFEGRESLSSRTDEFARHLTELEKLAAEMDCPILLTCQVYPRPDQYGNRPVLYGGSLMKHTVNFVCMMQSKQGALCELTVMNHPSVPEETLNLQITDAGVHSPRDGV